MYIELPLHGISILLLNQLKERIVVRHYRILTGLRFKFDENSFDANDYKKENPLAFDKVANDYLLVKKKELKTGSFRNIKKHMYAFIDNWKDTNIKDVGFIEIQKFILNLDNITDKTRFNYLTTLNAFMNWLEKAIPNYRKPQFPEVKYELGYRNTIDKDTQDRIIDECYRIVKDYNLRIWIGIKFLATYFNARPHEIMNIKEGDIDLRSGEILIPHPKERKAKIIYLLPEDVELLKTLPRGMPQLFFFRHKKGVKGVKADKRFGEHLFYTTWKKACDNLNIKNVDLYGGTRHSTVKALRKFRTPEEIKLGSMHSTNKAFERYYQTEPNQLRSIYQDTRSTGKELAKNFKGFESYK